MNNDNDYDVDQIWGKLSKPRRINSGDKGDRGENDVIKLFTERFNLPFSRVPDSGARMSQVAIPEELKTAYQSYSSIP